MINQTDILCQKILNEGLWVADPGSGSVYSNRCHRYIGGHDTKGYRVTTLHLDGVRKQIKLHRFIWISVNGIPSEGTMIDHINRDKSDNRIINLRLVDAKLNSRNRRKYTGENNPAAKIDQETVSKIRQEYAKRDKDIYHHDKSYRKLAKKYSVSPTLIAKIIKKEIWK